MYITEIFPLRARGLGFGIASAVGAIASSSGQFVLSEMEEKGINPMISLTICAVLPAYLLTFLNETHKKPLETEIEEILEEKKNIQKSIVVEESPEIMMKEEKVK